jgi:hypothetical protein
MITVRRRGAPCAVRNCQAKHERCGDREHARNCLQRWPLQPQHSKPAGANGVCPPGIEHGGHWGPRGVLYSLLDAMHCNVHILGRDSQAKHIFAQCKHPFTD